MRLFRYSLTGGYYAQIKTVGKEICKSLETTDRDLPKRQWTKVRLMAHFATEVTNEVSPPVMFKK